MIINEQDILKELDQSFIMATPQKPKRTVRKSAAARKKGPAPPTQENVTTPTHNGRLPF